MMVTIRDILETLKTESIDSVEILTNTDDGNDVVRQTSTGFSGVGSWRGSYSEPCLYTGTITDPDELKYLLTRLTTEVFTGYKGGEFTYSLDDELNVEKDYASYTADGYICKCVVKDKVLILVCDKSF